MKPINIRLQFSERGGEPETVGFYGPGSTIPFFVRKVADLSCDDLGTLVLRSRALSDLDLILHPFASWVREEEISRENPIRIKDTNRFAVNEAGTVFQIMYVNDESVEICTAEGRYPYFFETSGKSYSKNLTDLTHFVRQPTEEDWKEFRQFHKFSI